jgi:uncharacterized membrane protein HdeD (DUF308 family)
MGQVSLRPSNRKGSLMNALGVLLPRTGTQSPVGFALIQLLLGLLAAITPLVSPFEFGEILACLLVASGFAQLFYASGIHAAGRIATWTAFVAGLHLGAGAWLLTAPLLGFAGVTFLIIWFFFAEGLIDTLTYLLSPRGNGSFWILLGGLTTMIVTMMMWWGWPSVSALALGSLAGICMSIAGTTRLLLALGLRKAAEVGARRMPEWKRVA